MKGKVLLMVAVGVLLLVFSALFLWKFAGLYDGFPFGVDAPHHINWARSFVENTYPPELLHNKVNPSPYPLPELVFATLQQFFGQEYPIMFIGAMAFFLFLNCLAVFLLSKKLWGVHGAVLSVLFLFGMPFFWEEPIIGLFAQIFSRSLLFFILYLFISRKFWLCLTLLPIAYLSHPFIGVFIGGILALYVPFLLYSERQAVWNIVKHYWWVVILGFVGAVGGFAGLFVLGRVDFLIELLFSDQNIISGGVAYSLDAILSKTRYVVLPYFLGLLGFISYYFFSKRKRYSEIIFFSVVFTFFMVFNDVYLIDIEPFRFISYLEMFVVIFVPKALIDLMEILRKKNVVFAGALILILVLISGNFANASGLSRFYSREDTTDKLPAADLAAIEWVDANLDKSRTVCANYKWGHWIAPIARQKAVYSIFFGQCRKAIEGGVDALEIFEASQDEKEYYDYIFVSSQDNLNPALGDREYFDLIYQKSGVSIYEIRK